MSEYLSTTLQEGSQAVSLAARPSAPQAIRARGDLRRRRSAMGMAVAALAVVAVGAGAYPLARDLGAGPAAAGGGAAAGAERIVPRLAGVKLATAEQVIIRAGLSVGQVSRQASAAVPPGLVIRTSPGYGASASRGTPVNIVVSAGSGTIVVPDVVGFAGPVSVQMLGQLQLRVELRTSRPTTFVPGTVIRESPPAGSAVPRGATIVLYLEPTK